MLGTTSGRAVDQDGVVLDVLVQRRRDAVAAKKFFRKLLKGLRYVPRVIVTDKLGSYQAAHRAMAASAEHRRLKLPQQLSRELPPTHASTGADHEVLPLRRPSATLLLGAWRDLLAFPSGPAPDVGHGVRTEMSQRFTTWNEVTGIATAA